MTTPGPLPGYRRGIAAIQFQGRTLRFRTNPNSIWWSYKLITSRQNTYGGQVIQILGARIDDLVVTADIGNGGWPYLRQIVAFMRDMINDQRKGEPGLFIYTTRNWRLKVFAASVPFQDTVTATTREIELRFKVQEDVSGVMSGMSISNSLARMQDGIGFRKKQGINVGSGGTDQFMAPIGAIF